MRSISETSSCLFGPRPWHIKIRHRVKTNTSTINLFGFETLQLKIRRLKLWKPSASEQERGSSIAGAARPISEGPNLTCMYIYLVRHGNRQDVFLWFPSSTSSNASSWFPSLVFAWFPSSQEALFDGFRRWLFYGFRRGRTTFCLWFPSPDFRWILPSQEDSTFRTYRVIPRFVFF